MKKVKRRTYSIYLMVLVIVACMTVFLFRYAADGADWVTFPSNQNVYRDGMLAMGSIYDRNGTLLAEMDAGGQRYAEGETVRRSTLHVVGDYGGNIGTGALNVYADKLVGYSMINGTYSYGNVGNQLHLTIDAELNAAAYQALAGRKGMVGVYNYETGEILCNVSAPAYDPANMPQIAEGDSSYDGVYLNRFLSSTFTPGSIFKLVTTACAIDHFSDAFDRQYTCNGSMSPAGGGTITCTGTHGTIALDDALAYSCNCYFAYLALDLGGERLKAYTEKLGLTAAHRADGIPTAAGSFTAGGPDSPDLAWSGSGQYETLINPASFLRFLGAVAGDGVPTELRYIHKVTNGAGIPAGVYRKSQGEEIMSASTATALRRMMRNNVVSNYGADRFPGLEICAKSGTAEVGDGKAPHAWFAGFLNDPDNPLAFIVLVENGGGGLSSAGAVANTVLQAAVS